MVKDIKVISMIRKEAKSSNSDLIGVLGIFRLKKT